MLSDKDRIIEAELFKYFIKNNTEFFLLKENKRKTFFTLKPLDEKGEAKEWSYIVNFDYGTLRRVVAYHYDTSPTKRNVKNYISKFSYYCNKRYKVLARTSPTYYPQLNHYSCHIKIFNHLEMYRKLIDAELSFKPKNLSRMVDCEFLPYGITKL